MKPETKQPVEVRGKFLSTVLFGSRWLQVPLYLGLIGAQLVYVVHFMVEREHLVVGTFTLSEEAIMLIVLGLIDVVMMVASCSASSGGCRPPATPSRARG